MKQLIVDGPERTGHAIRRETGYEQRSQSCTEVAR